MNKIGLKTRIFGVVWILLMIGAFFIEGSFTMRLVLYGGIGLFIAEVVAVILTDVNKEVRRSKEEIDKGTRLPEANSAYVKGKDYYRYKKLEKALECFDIAIENGQADNLTYCSRADCLQALEFHSEAIEDYGKAIDCQPDDCRLYFQRSISRRAIGDIEGALDDLERAVELTKIDNYMNRGYADEAKTMGWPEGHTVLYEAHLLATEQDRIVERLLVPRWQELKARRRGATAGSHKLQWHQRESIAMGPVTDLIKFVLWLFLTGTCVLGAGLLTQFVSVSFGGPASFGDWIVLVLLVLGIPPGWFIHSQFIKMINRKLPKFFQFPG